MTRPSDARWCKATPQIPSASEGKRLSRLDWERLRRQSAVWERGGEPVARDLGSATTSDEIEGYVTQRRQSRHQEAGRRVRSAGNQFPSLVPLARRKNIYARDWEGVKQELIESAARLRSGQCFAVLHGRRQILFGRWDQRFVAVANDKELSKKLKQRLDLAGFHAETETFHKGTWFVFQGTIADHSRQAWLVNEVLRDSWQLRMPAQLVLGEVYVQETM